MHIVRVVVWDGLHNPRLKMAASATVIRDSGFSMTPAGGSMT
jgi:hypothetical protein